MTLLEILRQPWPWYIAGPLIGLVAPALLLIGNKSFGISASLRHTCAILLPAKIPFFNYKWSREMWNMVFVLGIFVGGIIATAYLSNPEAIVINPDLRSDLATYGVTDINGLLPAQLFSWESLFTLRGFLMMVVGGFMVGFGVSYAGGCTSGHAILGISNLQVPSVIATCCFMVGGFIMVNLILPFILSL
jgi:uncharacterized protein